jgi:hypothetical protein
MAIKFKGSHVRGVHGRILVSPVNLQRSVTKYQGVNGASEIYGGQGTRRIRTHIWLMNQANPYTKTEMSAALRALVYSAGEFGELKIEEPGIPDFFKFCTFIGFTEDEEGMKFDPTGDHGYWTPGWLEWEQLFVGVRGF